ncbi:MAG: nitroreductase [Desulfarculaceae bacterium]|nr:nitroreductase [Desulfarculaceae bacterium]
MDYREVLDKRFSCRAYQDKPVSREAVERIAALAQRSPSWGNTQPARLYAVGGDKAKEIRRRLVDAMLSERPQDPDLGMPTEFEAGMAGRYKDQGRRMFAALGITREDPAKREAHYQNNFGAFGAPCLLFITVPKGQSAYVLYDAGAFVHGLCLAAAAEGLNTVILAALARFPEEVRAVVPLPEDEALVVGVALGHGELEAPGAKFRSTRRPQEEVLATFDL